MAVRYENRVKTYDTLGVLAYSANYATAWPGKNSSGATTQYVDLGGTGYTEGKVVFDVTDMGIITGTGMQYTLFLQGGKTSSFASTVPLAILELGDATNFASAQYQVAWNLKNDREEGRFVIPFHNEYGGELYRYLRTNLRLGHTVATFTYSAFVTK